MSSISDRTFHRCATLATALILITLTSGASFAQEPSKSVANAPSVLRLFRQVGDFPLGKATNRMDYQSFDPAAHRLYIAKMGAGELVVFDVQKNGVLPRFRVSRR